MASKPPPGAAYAPPAYEPADIGAMKALAAGVANDFQQKRVLHWLIETVCGTYDLSFRPQSERETCFAEGRRFVGLTMVKVLHLQAITQRNDDGRASKPGSGN
jgi:hypothetical protein